MSKEKVVLAYSGGLDTSVCVKWLQDEKNLDVVCVCGNVGQEETGLDFASTNENMHACGHDAHTAMLLGLAQLLKKRESPLPGRVRLLFQPGNSSPG